MKAFKGFNKDMTCRDFQYKEGKTFKEDEAKLCIKGFHACLDPIDCFRYYEPNTSVYHEVDVDEVSDERNEDSKIVAKRIKIGAKISIAEICKLHFDYLSENIKDTDSNTSYRSAASNTGDYSAASNTGNRSAASNTGNRSAASNTGDYSAASNTGNRSAASNTGDCSAAEVSGMDSVAIVTGYKSKAKANLGSAIVIAERTRDGKLIDIKSAIVDGKTLKADTWYTLNNGKFIECE